MPRTKTMTVTAGVFKPNQLVTLVASTPEEHIRTRKGRGNRQFRYVTGSYVQSVLNRVFGWGWSFEVKSHGESPDKSGVWVLGRLTILDPLTKQTVVIKEQFGSSEIKKETASKKEVDYADDLKSAATDALKKCASLMGIAADVYGDPEVASELAQKAADVTKVILENRQKQKEATKGENASTSK